ncbi:hypothetical protein HDV63DRAFT_395433 [Trichoderma sp. SZMC 28014]
MRWSEYQSAVESNKGFDFCSVTNRIPHRAPKVVLGGFDRNPWRALSAGKSSPLLQPSEWREYGSLGQARQRRDEPLGVLPSNESLAARINKTLEDTEADIEPYDAATWEAVCGVLSDMYGPEGVWAVFQSIWQSGKHKVIISNDAEALRCTILSAALSSESRLSSLFTAARQLVAQENFQWPGLYTKIVHFFLERGDYEKAIRWDESLAPIFPAGAEEFGALLATFVTKPTPEMQSTLTALYVSGANRQLYDHVIPALFASGQSKLARTWRKKLVLFKDFPFTAKSRPFLLFIANYFPHVQLTESELAVAELNREWLAAETEEDEPFFEVDRRGVDRKGIHSDAFIAKWFASTWTSLEFAINLIYKIGSLALRDPDTKEVASRIAQVERLGIKISSQSYCKILIAFARNGEDDLLIDLLHCDIHPDEFEDMETRHSLMAEAARTGDWKMERLLQGIEWAIETGPTSRRLNSMLRSEISKRSLGKAREVLDRMEALKISMAQASATGLLKRVFWKLDSHPQRSQRAPQSDIGSRDIDDPFLDRALNVIRRISCHDVAIPIRYWKILLYKLGRSRRLDELEQLSLEIMQFYTPPYGGLVPVHRDDLPKHFNTEERESIPADLPFVHHHHPIRLLFDPSLQRSIVRWGFDQTLATKPQPPATVTSLQTPSFSQFDVARGVRLLATLRDQGALIDTQVVRSSVVSRIATGMVPGRPRHRARDSIEFSIENLMDLIEKAWGSEMFPDAPKVVREIEARKSKLWHRYPKLIDRTFNQDST